MEHTKHGKKRPRASGPDDSQWAPPHRPRDGELEKDFFTWLLGLSSEEFFSDYFERKPLHKSHGSATHFSSGRGSPRGIRADWSTERMLEAATSGTLRYSTDLNVVRLDPVLKQRVPYKTEGVITALEMQRCMAEGWSVRFLRPHEHAAANSAFIRCLEEVFSCYCGLNSYWTPASNQGFAPHYDDVDVFLLQLEGKKRWRLYAPPEEVDVLSRHSSEDYNPDEMPKPLLTVVLQPGDVLYMPRGCVHQGNSLPDSHSLHVTFSANQMNGWADFMTCIASYAIETLSANDITWRRTVPRSLFHHLGQVHSPSLRAEAGLISHSAAEVKLRKSLKQRIRELATVLSLALVDESRMDVYVDEYARHVMARCQPPAVTPDVSVAGDALTPSTEVLLVSRDAIRLDLTTPGEARVHHIGENAVICLAGSRGLLRFEADFAPAIAALVSSYPSPMRVDQLPFPAFDVAADVSDNQLILCNSLRDSGVLAVAGMVRVRSPPAKGCARARNRGIAPSPTPPPGRSQPLAQTRKH